VSFIIFQLAPGDPLTVFVNPHDFTAADAAQLAKRLGLDQPIHVQYLRWVREVLTGNFGFSYVTGRPVLTLILERLPATLLLTSTAMVLSFSIGIVVGVISATRRYRWLDRALTTLSFAGISMPEFFLCVMLLYVGALRLQWLPPSGFGTVGSYLAGWALWLDRLPYLVMPALALMTPSLAGLARFTRSSMLDVLSEDYVRTARAKGLHEREVMYRHALKNSLIPVITLLGLEFPALFAGAFVVEYIFDWPGMGTLAVNAARNREYSILMALTIVSGMLVCFQSAR
jgi:peptide/nickel transport system permease protein